MQKHNAFIQDIRGCMTQIDPVTTGNVAAETKAGLIYQEQKVVMLDCPVHSERKSI